MLSAFKQDGIMRSVIASNVIMLSAVKQDVIMGSIIMSNGKMLSAVKQDVIMGSAECHYGMSQIDLCCCAECRSHCDSYL